MEVVRANVRLKLYAIKMGWKYPGPAALLEMYPLEDL
jgi:hypothetical protein